MLSRLSLLACSLFAAASLTAIPSRAESRYSTNRFEITFGDGWQEQASLVEASPGGDSALSLMYGYSMLGYCFMSASLAEQPVTDRDFETFRKQYAGADSVLQVAEGSDTLGGKAFSYVEYKNADSANGDIRIRLYSASEGPLRFQSMLVYDSGVGSNLVAEMDSALAGLTFSPTPIRSRLSRPPLAERPAEHDILGRFRPLAVRSVLLRMPER
jgi:hypothetical protein